MLVAKLDGTPIPADMAEKGHEYRCGKCNKVVTLKKGRIVTHHFAHRPPVNCSWGKGETHTHLEAKKLFRDALADRGLRAENEVEIDALPNDRRADVVVWSPAGERFAIELQHTPISYDNLEDRTRSYIGAGVRVIWVPFFRPKYWEGAEPILKGEGDFRIKRYPARPLDKWVSGFNFGKFWMYDPSRKKLWKCKLEGHLNYVEETSWYEEGGEENSAGGYSYYSKRWRELVLTGPIELSDVRIRRNSRKAKNIGKHRYPSGRFGQFVVSERA